MQYLPWYLPAGWQYLSWCLCRQTHEYNGIAVKLFNQFVKAAGKMFLFMERICSYIRVSVWLYSFQKSSKVSSVWSSINFIHCLYNVILYLRLLKSTLHYTENVSAYGAACRERTCASTVKHQLAHHIACNVYSVKLIVDAGQRMVFVQESRWDHIFDHTVSQRSTAYKFYLFSRIFQQLLYHRKKSRWCLR